MELKKGKYLLILLYLFSCKQCNDKYALDYSNHCQYIGVSNCLYLNFERNKCRQCISGYTLNANGECIQQKCNDTLCTSCPEDINKCLACADEYYLASDGTCQCCAPNCRQCSNGEFGR